MEYLPKWVVKGTAILLMILIFLTIIKELQSIKAPIRILRVSAEGKVTVIPDYATVTLGVFSQANSAVEVKNQNNQKMNQVIAFIKQQGIDPQSIQTTDFYASPQYNYVNGQSTLSGYQASQTVTVKIDDVNKSRDVLNKILDGAVNQGANQVQSVNFGVTDSEKFQQQARIQAIDNARIKARELAEAAHLELGDIMNLDLNNDRSYPVAMAAVNTEAKVKSIGPNIQIGSQEVTETMTVLFSVK